MRHWLNIVENSFNNISSEETLLRNLCDDAYHFELSPVDQPTWYLDSNLNPVILINPVMVKNAFERLSPDELQKFFLDPFFGILPHETMEAKITLMLSMGRVDEVLASYPKYKPSPKMLKRLKSLHASKEEILHSFGEGMMFCDLEWVAGEAHDIVTAADFDIYHHYVLATDQILTESFKIYPLAPHNEWYGNCNYADYGGRMVYMTPDEFLSKVRPLHIDDSSRDNINDLKNHIESGRTLDPLVIYPDGKEDGRHRAVAAKELGITQIPVIIFKSITESSNKNDWMEVESPQGDYNTQIELHTPLGKVGLVLWPEEPTYEDTPEAYVELVNLEVPERERRNGYGERLVRLALQKAKSLGYDRVYVRVEDEPSAKAFWKRYGIEETAWITT